MGTGLHVSNYPRDTRFAVNSHLFSPSWGGGASQAIFRTALQTLCVILVGAGCEPLALLVQYLQSAVLFDFI